MKDSIINQFKKDLENKKIAIWGLGKEGISTLQFIKNKFPSLYKYEKLTLCNTCIYNYQMILKNHNIDPDNIGRNKLKVYRKNIEFSFKDLEYYTLKDRIKIILSSISLDFYCKFKNKTRWD